MNIDPNFEDKDDESDELQIIDTDQIDDTEENREWNENKSNDLGETEIER